MKKFFNTHKKSNKTMLMSILSSPIFLLYSFFPRFLSIDSLSSLSFFLFLFFFFPTLFLHYSISPLPLIPFASLIQPSLSISHNFFLSLPITYLFSVDWWQLHPHPYQHHPYLYHKFEIASLCLYTTDY